MQFRDVNLYACSVQNSYFFPSSDTFHSLLSFTLNHTYSLFDSTYETISQDAKPLVSTLFSDLDLYLRGDANISVEHAVHSFYDKLFPLVYQHLVNPGLGSNVSTWSFEGSECLRATRHDVNPFGLHPQELAQELSRALVAGHALSRALAVGAEVLNATESVGMARQCGRALVRMLFCPHCRGLTLIRPCGGLCLNVMRGCLAGVAELDGPWRRYVALLEGLSGALSGGYEVELALLHIRERINDAILTAQLHGPHLSTVVSHAFLIHRTRLFLFHKWAAPYAGLIRSSVHALTAACSSDQMSRPIGLCSCKAEVLLNCYSCMYLNLKLIILINELLA